MSTEQSDLVITMLGGFCPVQGEGTICGRPFYFRARGTMWTFSVGDDFMKPDWRTGDRFGDEDNIYAAGWMELDVAREFIEQSAAKFRVEYLKLMLPELPLPPEGVEIYDLGALGPEGLHNVIKKAVEE